MTKEEFYSEYKRINAMFPGSSRYPINNPDKMREMFNAVSHLPVSWMRSFVNRVIASGETSLDIFEGAKGETRAKNDFEKTKSLLKDSVEVSGSIDQMLGKIGVDSLWGAVLKNLGDKK